MSKKYGRQFLKTISKPATNPPVGFTEIFADIDNDGAIMILTPDGTATPAGGAEVSYSDTDPAMDGIAAQGTSDKVSRQDHVHPSDTSKITANAPITPGTGTKITYDASGLVTGSTALSATDIPDFDAAKVTSGVLDIARIPAAAIERLVPVADQTARYALTSAIVQLGDTVKQLDTGIMYVVVDTANLANSAGYSEYTAGSAATVPWSGVSSKPTTLTGYGITDAAAQTHTHGNITNTGYIGTTAGLPIVTSTSGIVAAGAWYASTPAAATTTGGAGASTSPARGDHAHPSRIATSAPASPVNGDIWMV